MTGLTISAQFPLSMLQMELGLKLAKFLHEIFLEDYFNELLSSASLN